MTGRAKKRFGQHFLAPEWVVKVLRVLAARPEDTFLEIGPGGCALTRPLAAASRAVIAFEIDRDLTADLRVEFMRSARPGTLRADGRVVQRNRRVAFCSADLYDAEGTLLASSRCTQIMRRDG